MSGLGTRKRNSSNFLGIFNGKIVKEWNQAPEEKDLPRDEYGEPMELFERKITKGKNEGKTRYYVEFEYLEGDIENMELEQTDWGESIKITIRFVTDVYELSFGIFDNTNGLSAMGRAFLVRLPNIDLDRSVRFEPWQMSGDDFAKLTGRQTAAKTKSGLNLYQDGRTWTYKNWDGDTVTSKDKAPPYYTKAEPNGLPELVQKKVRGKVTYNSEDHDNFLLGMLDDLIAERYSGNQAEPAPAPAPEPEEVEEAPAETETPAAKKRRQVRASREAQSAKPQRKQAVSAPKDDLPF